MVILPFFYVYSIDMEYHQNLLERTAMQFWCTPWWYAVAASCALSDNDFGISLCNDAASIISE